MTDAMPMMIRAEAAVKSTRKDYISLFDSNANRNDLKKCRADPKILKATVSKLKEAGFGIITVGRCTVSLIGTPSQFESMFDCTLSLGTLGTFSVPTVVGIANDSSLGVGKHSKLIVVSNRISESGIAHVLLSEQVSLNGESRKKDGGKASKDDVYLDEIRQLVGATEGEKVSGRGVGVSVIDSGLNTDHEYVKKWEKPTCIGLSETVLAHTKSIATTLLKDASEILAKAKKLGKRKNWISRVKKELDVDDWTAVSTLIDRTKTEFSLELVGQKNILKVLDDTRDYVTKAQNLKGRRREDTITSKDAFALAIEPVNKMISLLFDIREKKVVAFTDDSQIDHLDRNGHGTAVCANLVSVAPKANLMSNKCVHGSYANRHTSILEDSTDDALFRSENKKVSIVVCAWGSFESTDDEVDLPRRNLWSEKLSSRKLKEKLLVFGAGNSSNRGKSIQANLKLDHLLTVGGAHIQDNGQASASNGAQGYPARKRNGSEFPAVPHICGLVGHTPKNSDQDVGMIWCPTGKTGKSRDPMTDWEKSSGTSLAAPQIAGVAALILEVWRQATPADLKRILTETSTLVKKGETADGHKLVSEEMNVGTGSY